MNEDYREDSSVHDGEVFCSPDEEIRLELDERVLGGGLGLATDGRGEAGLSRHLRRCRPRGHVAALVADDALGVEGLVDHGAVGAVVEAEVVTDGGVVEGGVAVRVLPPDPTSLPQEHSYERRAELGGGHVVEDRVDGGVDVVHDAAEVEEVVVDVDAQGVDGLMGDGHDPEEEYTQRHQTQEEEEDYRGQHHDHLPPRPHLRVLLLVRQFVGVHQQLASDDSVHPHQEQQRQEEEQDVRDDEERLGPVVGEGRVATGLPGAVMEPHSLVLDDA